MMTADIENGTENNNKQEQPVNLDKPQEGEPVPDTDNTNKSGLVGIALGLALLLGLSGTIVGSIGLNKALNNDNDNRVTTTNALLDNSTQLGRADTRMKENSPKLEGSATLYSVTTNQKLKCGVPYNSPGFGLQDNNGTFSGFNIDLCRAVAAAVFGSAEGNVEYIPVSATNRFQALASGQIDLLTKLTTHTMERDVWLEEAQTGFSFSVPYLYESTIFGGIAPFTQCAEFGKSNAMCTDTRICVQNGTTALDVVTGLVPAEYIVVQPTSNAVIDGFVNGTCNVVAGLAHQASPDAVRARGFVGSDYAAGDLILSSEPLAMVTRQDDARWSDFVNWVLQSLIAAEEQNVTQVSASTFTTTAFFGEQFSNMFVNAISQVGNYGEMYERNLQDILPRSGMNLNNFGESGLIFAHPFGNLETVGPSPIEGGTLAKIMARGHLKCGITRRASFGEFDATDFSWFGLDVDYCKALSAAIFDGVPTHVVYVVLPATERFKYLAEGRVDVLSRITTVTLERDALEPTSGMGFTFSQPNFYDGLSFGGIPPFAQCADRLDATSPECVGLMICVNDGTTTITRTRELFPETNIRPMPTGIQSLMGLSTGECNVVAGGSHDIAEGSVRGAGFVGDYVIGGNRFSKDPLALVTRQDDSQWSDFVYWVVAATFGAEEAGATQSSPDGAPLTNLFGRVRSRIFRDAIQAVGNYGQIYERHVQALVPRAGLNLLNNGGAQLYALPGVQANSE